MYSIASTTESTEFTVVDPTTGIPTNADSTPTATLRRNESASGVTVTMTNLATGRYRASWTNGAWTAGDRLTLEVSATVSSDIYTETIWEAKVDVTSSSRLAPTTAGRTIDIDANGYVERVVLCDTTTTNSDMRGTDSAFLAANAPANFGDLAITATTGKVTVGTNDDKTGYALSASGVTAVQSGLATAAAISALNDVSTADIDARLAAYDSPTKAEMDAAFTEIKGATWSSLTDTLEAIRDRGDSAWITATGFSTLDAAGIRTAVGLASANLDTQLGAITADTNELQGDWTNGGRLDLILDSILEDTGTTLPATLSIIAGYIDTEIAAIKAKTDNLPTDPATETTLAALDNLIDAIKAVTDKLNTGLEDDGSSGYQFTTLALENGPSGSGLDAAGVRAAVGLASANLDTQLGGVSKADKLLKYIQLIARSDSAIATDNSTELGEINADGGSGAGDYSPPADSLEASQAEHDATQTAVGGIGGDATAANQTSILAAITALENVSQAQVQTACTSALTTYDPPTRTEATADKAEILTAVGNVGGAVGSGADSVTLTILHEITGLPIADADVWISTDVNGSNVVAGTLPTNSSGEVTFMLDAGETYYCWRQRDGINFDNPQSFTAVAD